MHDPVSRRRRFEELAAEVYEPLQRYVRRRVSAGWVDDVVSETMTTLWKRLDDIPRHAALPWAYGVARRQIANHRRGVRRHLRLVERIEAEPLTATNSETPLDPELEHALAGLGESDREILRLWAWEQLEAAEIATVMGLTANAASIRLHRAKKKLGENLESERKNQMTSGHRPGERRKEERR
jgi:RNA polymerase sigma-70 factor, ECF subfamily